MDICVYASSADKIQPIYKEETEKLGRRLAEKGHHIVYGGGARGLMGAIARGAKSADGKVTGIAPSFFDVDGELYDDCDHMIMTETMRERKKLLQQKSQVFLVLPGGIGTLDEFFETLVLKAFDKQPKPVILYNINGYFDKLREMMDHGIREHFIAPRIAKLYHIFDNAEELIIYLEVYKMLDKEE